MPLPLRRANVTAVSLYVLAAIASWLLMCQVRELFIAYYNGVALEASKSTKVLATMQAIVNLAAVLLATTMATST